jgi:hypothetical protein
VAIIDEGVEGLGQKFLQYVHESTRWQQDLIKAIHRDDASAKARGFAGTSASNPQREEELQRNVLGHLHFVEMKDRENRIMEAHKETFQWIFGKPESVDTPWPSFANWLTNESGLYWITGKAGSGKSTLMKYIYNDPRTLEMLRVWSSDAPLITSAFYFWNSGANIQMSHIGLLQSVLYQILVKQPQFIPRLFPSRWEAYSLFGYDPEPLSEKELQRAFKLLSKENPTGTNFCFFIDGLDEYDGNHTDLNNLFKEVACSRNIKLCISSRPWNIFEDAFGNRSFLMLQDLTLKDIQIYVSSSFKNHAGFTELEKREPDFSRQLKDHIVEKASGVFLWVHLVVKSLLAGLLNGDRVSDLERRLDLLPPDLEHLYDKMLNSLDPFYYSHASQLFQLIRAAQRPPTLLDLYFADEESWSVFDCNITPLTLGGRLSRADEMRKRLNSRCKGLLEIETGPTASHKIGPIMSSRPSGFERDPRRVPLIEQSKADATVQYLHRTVKDYLEDSSVWEQLLQVGPANYNPTLALCRSHIEQFKHLDPESLDRYNFWNAIKKCIFNVPRTASSNDSPQMIGALLDELDHSATWLANCLCADGSTFLSRYSQFSPPAGIDLYPHWTSTFSGYKEKKGLTFLSLAVKLNLSCYVSYKSSDNCLVMQDSGIWSLLMDAITLDSTFNRFFEITAFPTLSMVTLLLARGANPNWRHSSGTVFETLLEQATSAGGVGTPDSTNPMDQVKNNDKWKLKSAPLKLTETPRLGVTVLCRSLPGTTWVEAMYEFLAHGADPTIDIEASLGISFLGAKRSPTQVKSNKGFVKVWFGIGNNMKVYKG